MMPVIQSFTVIVVLLQVTDMIENLDISLTTFTESGVDVEGAAGLKTPA
ncbi:hypothetical protein M495_10610 [Serratia liquefaciens ATCC 27592]|nr:hypothetical protein M495_10610 [Serratia liquefaciens ATCC 27592]